MATERQISANRRNAQKSTGPSTELGKQRSSKNAYSHGLSLPIRNVASQKQLEELSGLFVGDSCNAKILELAGIVADSQAELERVRKVKSAMLERARAQLTHGRNRAGHDSLDSSRTLLDDHEDRLFAEAVQHIIPELTKITRYEKRAASRRNRAIHELAFLKNTDVK